MGLFRDIDVPKTCNKVHKFLTKDLDRLLLMSGRTLTDLRSPQLTLAPGSTNRGNSNEDRLIRGLDAELEVRAIRNTINRLPETSKIIITDMYIYKMSSQQCKEAVRYESSRYYDLRRRAQLAFADAFDYQQKVLGIKTDYDLHVYLD